MTTNPVVQNNKKLQVKLIITMAIGKLILNKQNDAKNILSALKKVTTFDHEIVDN